MESGSGIGPRNRYGLPAELPLSWPALMQTLARDPNTTSKEN